LLGVFQNLEFEFGGKQSGFVSSLNGFCGFFMFSPSILKLECLQDSDIGQYVVQAIFFPITAIGFALITVASRISNSLRVCADRALNTLLTINQGLLITFATLSMSAFQCFTHFEDVRTMFQFPQTMCYDANHAKFIIVSVFMLLTVVFPFNCIFLYSVWILYARRSDAQTSVKLLVRFKLFFQRWRPDRWYWGYVFVLRQMLFACILVVAGDAAAQLVFAIVILVSYCVVLALFSPWRLFEMNVVEFVFGVMLVFLLVIQLALISEEEQNNFVQMFEILLALLVCFAILYAIRICAQGIMDMNKTFVGFPKILDAAVLGKCLEMLSTSNLSADVVADLVGNLSEQENRLFSNFVCLLEKQSISNFNFPSGRGVGMQIFVPSSAMMDDEFAPKMAAELKKIKSKTSANESYI